METASSDPWQRSALPRVPRRAPWCPGPEDGGFLREAATAAIAAAGSEPIILVLGVTPELVQLDWPEPATLVAADSSPSMIASSWRPHPTLNSEVLCAQWQALPFEDESITMAAGDGSLNALPGFEDYPAVLREVARVLVPGGTLAVRCFLKPEPVPAPAQIVRAAERGEYPTVAAFRLPFTMAVAGENVSVGLAELPECLNALVADRDGLAKAAGWPREDVDRFDIDVGSPIRLNFPTESQLRAAVQPFFELRALRYGSYTQSGLCPTAILRRK